MSSDYVLYMGAIDDADITYINGHKVGSMWSWNENRIYTVPSDIMKEGENIIVIKQYDGGGGSSVKGSMFLENENGEKINIEGEWAEGETLIATVNCTECLTAMNKYNWSIDGKSISNTNSYLLTSADLAKKIRIDVSANNNANLIDNAYQTIKSANYLTPLPLTT